ncbi:MAG TPA: helix-turn-helix transcriptional regulator [Phycisphaerae bacterium]|nr:helix-turn-helix transcriptional regulator [Phycisphaerae bacterium]
MPFCCDKLKRLRARRKLTQQALADRAGLHRVEIARLEAGSRAPTLATLERLAAVLHCRIAALCGTN